MTPCQANVIRRRLSPPGATEPCFGNRSRHMIGFTELALLYNLSSIITAGDPPERSAEGFGIDGGGKIRARAAPGTGAGAAQELGNEVAIKVRQARPEAACERLRQAVVGMARVFGSAADFIHVPDLVPRRALGGQASENVRMLLRHIEAIEGVE